MAGLAGKVTGKGCLIIVETVYGRTRKFAFSRNGLVAAQKYGAQLSKSGSVGLAMLKCDRGSTPLFQCRNERCSLDFMGGSDTPMTGTMKGKRRKRRKR